jgi:hypothetical protein
VQRQATSGEIGGDPIRPGGQDLRLVVEQREVVDVPQVARSSQHLLAEMIEAIEVDVGEELAGQVADRQPPPAAIGLEEIVARIVEVDRFLGVRAIDDGVEQPQRRRTTEAPAKVGLQDLVVDGREVAIDVAPQDMAVAIAEALVPRHSTVGAFADPVGIAVVDEAALEDRPDDVVECMVHNPISEWRRRNHPAFRVVHLEGQIPPRLVCLRVQLPFEPQQLGFEIGHEGGGARLAPLALDGASGSRVQRPEAGDPAEEVVMPRRHRSLSASRQ